MIMLSTSPTGCMLLYTDNWWRVEKDLGKGFKPALCNLFPFNTYKRIGRTIAVYPHFLCPLRLEIPAKPGDVEGTHAFVETAFRSSGLFDPGYSNAHVPSVHVHPSLDTDQVVMREREFLKKSTATLGRKRFSDLLKKSSVDPLSLETFLERATGVLGLPRSKSSKERDGIDDILSAIASPLRLQLLTLSSEGILRALALGELLIRRIATRPVEPVTPQVVFRFLEVHLAGIRFLARGEEIVPIPSNSKLTLPAIGDPGLTFSSFVFLRELQSSGNVLQSFEKAIPPNLSIADRSTFVQITARNLDDFLVELNESPAKSARRKRARRIRT